MHRNMHRKFSPFTLRFSAYAPPILRRFRDTTNCFHIY